MNKTNSFMNKILAGFLSLAMVITGALSLGTMKTHTASADMEGFVVNMMNEILESPGSSGRICMLVDNILIPNAEEGTRISQVARDVANNGIEADDFILDLISVLGVSATPNDFRDHDFYIFAQSAMDNSYIDLITGNEIGFYEVEENCLLSLKSRDRSGNPVYFSESDTIFVGVMNWGTNIEIINSYKDLKDQLGESNFTVYAHPGENYSYPSGIYDLWVRLYNHLFEEFSDQRV